MGDDDLKSTVGWGTVFRSFWGTSFLFAVLIALAIGLHDATKDFGQPFAASREEVLLMMLAISSWLIGVIVRRFYRSTRNAALGALYGFLMMFCVTTVAVAGAVSVAGNIVAFPHEWHALLNSTSFAEAFRNSLEYPWFVWRILTAVAFVAAVIVIVSANSFDMAKRR